MKTCFLKKKVVIPGLHVNYVPSHLWVFLILSDALTLLWLTIDGYSGRNGWHIASKQEKNVCYGPPPLTREKANLEKFGHHKNGLT